jgi:hypothetical protein
MTFARTAFKKIQVSGVEGTPGSAGAATAIITGATMDVAYADRTLHHIEQDKNILSKNIAGDSIVAGKEISGTAEMAINLQNILYALTSCIRGNITPTQPDATNEPLSYLWTIEPTLTAGNTPDITDGIDTFTLEFGDDEQDYEAEFVFTNTLTITGDNAGEGLVMATWDWTARQLTESTLTAALTRTATQYFPTAKTKFFVDANYAGIGGSELPNMLRAFTITFNTTFTPRYTAGGTLLYTGLDEAAKSVELELVYNRGTNSELEKVKYNAQTQSYIRIEMNGESEMDSAQSNLPYLRFDASIEYLSAPAVSDENGMQIETYTAETTYDPTASKEYGVTMLTTLATYP